MRERFRRRSYVATSICVALLTIAAITSAKLAGLRWNHSESAPSGIWLVAVQQSPARGDYVEFCPRPFFAELFRARRYLSAGPCPGSTQTMLKQVAAIPGDVISIADEGVTVNGQAATRHGREA